MGTEAESPVKRATKNRDKRTGPCNAAGVTCDCQAFAAQPAPVDGFVTCVCHHTQWAHEEGKVDS